MQRIRAGIWLAVVIVTGLGNAAARGQDFRKVANGPVVVARGDTLGGVWVDFDGDGRLDLAVTRLSPRNSLYRNLGGEAFEEMPVTADFLPFTIPGSAMVFCDYDNDGDQDLFLATNSRDRLFERTGTGYDEVTQFPGESGFRFPMTANCADIDNDGFLDLFVATGGGGASVPDTLYRNQANGTFQRVTTGALVSQEGASGGSSWGDVDGDGWLDLFVPNGWTGNFLWRNRGQGRFELETTGPVATDRFASDGSAWGDYDNDGDFDLFVSNGANQNNALYRNDGGKLTPVTGSLVAAQAGYSVGAAWGDYDNDGRLDLAVANRLGPCFLYRQFAPGVFASASNVVTQTYADANSVSWGDFNDDGRLDLFVGNWSGEGGPDLDFLFVNRGAGAPTNAWLRVRLEGRTSNRSGIGAKIRVQARIGGEDVWQMRQIGGTDSAGAGALEAHFGLGDATVVDALRVEWPSGIYQVLTQVEPRQRLHLVEPASQPVVLHAEPPPGVFTNAVRVELKAEPPARIFYSVSQEGTATVTSVYTGPLVLRARATVRAQAYVGSLPSGEPFTGEYLRRYAHDGDGIPDAWRKRWFGDGYSPFDPRVDAESDPDGDGANNLLEYAAQTRPLDPESVFRVRVRLVPQIIWDGVPGVTYQVRRRNPSTVSGWSEVGAPIAGVDGVMRSVDAEIEDPYGVYVVEPNPPPP